MKLYHLANYGREWGFLACVVCANSEKDAREIASNYMTREDPVWLDTKQVKGVEIGVANQDIEAGVILSVVQEW